MPKPTYADLKNQVDEQSEYISDLEERLDSISDLAAGDEDADDGEDNGEGD